MERWKGVKNEKYEGKAKLNIEYRTPINDLRSILESEKYEC